MSTTSAAVAATDSPIYQWIWALLTISVSIVIELSLRELAISDLAATTRSRKLLATLENCLHDINTCLQDDTLESVQRWREKADTAQSTSEDGPKKRRAVLWRQAVYWILHVPLFVFVSIVPAGYLHAGQRLNDCCCFLGQIRTGSKCPC